MVEKEAEAGTRAASNLSAGVTRLVVVVPGLHGDLKRWQPLIDRLSTEPGYREGESSWLPFDHASRLWSVGSIDQLGRELKALITAFYTRFGSVGDIVLVGHSMGGLIVRHAYLLASGGVPDEEPSSWARKVSRIVLLASLNRGIDMRKLSWPERLLGYLARVLPLMPHLRVIDVQRGSDFLTNLRINWIHQFSSMIKLTATSSSTTDSASNPAAPLVVQVLGTADGLVAPEDSKDVLAFPEGRYLEVFKADHRTIFRLDQTSDPELRYAVLREAFINRFEAQAATQKAVDPVERVVFLLHGIRASNVDGWIEGLKQRIKAREGLRVTVKNPTYGYFSAARFALPTVRRKNIRIFQDWYTEELAKHPSAEFDVIAHSNGTYLLGHSLLHTPGMRFQNVALAGSVLPQDFWQRFVKFNRQVGRIRNDRADRDWPVALMCNALSGIRMRDVGTAGFAGFLGDMTEEVAYHHGGHGEALRENRLDHLVDFALGGNPPGTQGLMPDPGFYRQLSNSMPYLAKLVVLVAVIALSYFVFQGGTFHLDRALSAALGMVLLYMILDIV